MGDPDHDAPADEPETPQPATPEAAAAALDSAVAAWQRRGYRVRYRDEYLAQLVRRGWPDRRFVAVIAVGVAVIAAVVVAAILRRPWHVVSLTTSPEGQVITHRQWTPRPPSDE